MCVVEEKIQPGHMPGLYLESFIIHGYRRNLETYSIHNLIEDFMAL